MKSNTRARSHLGYFFFGTHYIVLAILNMRQCAMRWSFRAVSVVGIYILFHDCRSSVAPARWLLCLRCVCVCVCVFTFLFVHSQSFYSRFSSVWFLLETKIKSYYTPDDDDNNQLTQELLLITAISPTVSRILIAISANHWNIDKY